MDHLRVGAVKWLYENNAVESVINDLEKRAEEAKGKCLVWLNAMAARTGKSTISRTSAQTFADDGQLGVGCFFKRGKSDGSNAASISPFIGNPIGVDPAISEEEALKERFKRIVLQPLSKVQSVSISLYPNPRRTMKQLQSSRLVFSLILFSSISSTLGATIPSAPPPPMAEGHDKRDGGDHACGFAGNSDLYGLGIRLGVYFQWISAFIVSGWYQEGRQELVGAYLGFVFALLLAMIVVTLQAQPVYTAEILLLTYIIFGGTITVLTACALPQRVHSKGARPISPLSAVFWTAMIIYFAAGVYCSWFWLYGHRHGFLETPCGSFGFLFTRVSLYNSAVVKFFVALSIYVGILYGCILLGGLAVSILFLFKIPRVVELVNSLKTSKRPLYHAFATNENVPAVRHDGGFPWRVSDVGQKRLRLNLAALALALMTLIYSVVGIELTLYWNSISGVYTVNTTGQLIPFVIGLLGILKILYRPFLRWRKRHSASSASEGGSDSESVRESLRDEAREANRRLDYLDLTMPVEGLTIHEWRRDGLRRRNEQA